MLYTGYYINLDRASERRAAMEAQFARLNAGPRYRRFPAVDGNHYGFPHQELSDAQLGCLASHYMLLQMHRDGRTHLHVMEDDAIMATRTVQFIDTIISSQVLDAYDILFTSTVLIPSLEFFRDGRRAYSQRIQRGVGGDAIGVEFGVIDYNAGASSYIVNRKSIGAICDILMESIEAGADCPLDLIFREAAAAGRLRVKCLFPFMTSVQPGRFASSVEQAETHRPSLLAVDLLRHSFFVECDMQAALDLARQQLTPPDPTIHDRLHAHLFGYIASDAFERF